jgi:hypothetical protein
MEKTGVKRNLQEKAEYLLGKFPVLAILGARQTGKTIDWLGPGIVQIPINWCK